MWLGAIILLNGTAQDTVITDEQLKAERKKLNIKTNLNVICLSLIF